MTAPQEIPGLAELGKEVPIGDIDQELREFFATDETVTKASLLNLAVYSEQSDALATNPPIIRELTRENACRSLLVLSLHGPERSVRAWVEAHCHLTEAGAKAACSEQVSFLLIGGSPSLVRSMIFSNTDSDLPLVLWWQGEMSEVFEERLHARIDRLIFDSAQWATPTAPLFRLSASLKEGARFVPHDLSFTRGSALRACLAACFEDPRSLEALPQLDAIEIRHSPGQQGFMAALWLITWITHRLGWTLQGSASIQATYLFRSNNGRTVEANLLSTPDSGPALVGLKTWGAGFVFEASLDDDQDYWKLLIQFDTLQQESLFPARSQTPCGLLGEILGRAGRNRSMIEALPRLRELLVSN